MSFRTILFILLGGLTAGLVALNWEAIATPSSVNLGFTSMGLPLGLLVLGLMGLLLVVLASVIAQVQTNALLESRRQAKELSAQRELADRAEASRFTDLQTRLDASMQDLQARLSQTERALAQRIEEQSNSVAAAVGMVDDRLRSLPR